MSQQKIGSVMVVGGGIAGMQAALDAADRSALAENALPEGLYFVRAIYP